jgi:hypothetical protein
MKNFFALGMLACLLAGCSFDVQVVTPVPPTVAPTIQTIVANEPVSTLPAVNASPVFLPETSDPVFFQARVTAEQGGSATEARFPAGTQQLFAAWDYKNMRTGVTVKREWLLNGQAWLTREEPWDFAKYGANGTLLDVSIYDFEAGLPVGAYQLIVSIDGQVQPIGKVFGDSRPAGFLAFEIVPEREVASPNGQARAILNLGTLLLRVGNEAPEKLYQGREIVSVLWLDDQHLLFIDRDNSEQRTPKLLVGVRDELLSVDIVSREVSSLYAGETVFGKTGGLYPAPDGRIVAGIAGSGFGDACFIDAQLIFFALAADLKSARVIRQAQFTGLPAAGDGVVYPVAVGIWESDTQYSVALNQTCSSNPVASSIYLLDLTNQTATLQPAP